MRKFRLVFLGVIVYAAIASPAIAQLRFDPETGFGYVPAAKIVATFVWREKEAKVLLPTVSLVQLKVSHMRGLCPDGSVVDSIVVQEQDIVAEPRFNKNRRLVGYDTLGLLPATVTADTYSQGGCSYGFYIYSNPVGVWYGLYADADYLSLLLRAKRKDYPWNPPAPEPISRPPVVDRPLVTSDDADDD